MKNKLTLDWKEYYLVPVEEQDDVGKCWEKQELDKYKKIREVVERWRTTLAIKWDKKELMSHKDWLIVFDEIERVDIIDELHFEECTLWDLKENDVFVYRNIVYIIACISEWEIDTYTIEKDIIKNKFFTEKTTQVIKILRH